MDKKTTYKKPERQIQILNKKEEEIFNQLIKNSFDMIVLLDSKGIQRYVSESCERILGYKPQELINIPVIETMIHPDDQDKTMAGLNDILKKSTNGGVHYRHRHKNGNWVYLEAFGTNQIDNPLINSVILNVRDITSRKKVENDLIESKARLAEAISSKDSLFSIIGHDLKSPFHSILGFSQMLIERIISKDFNGIEEYAKIINDSSNRAMNLLENLLQWSQSQSGRIEFNPERLDIATIIGEVMDLLYDSAQQKSVLISTKVFQHIPVVADKTMLRTILRNLISNAVKFSNSGDEIIINTEQKKRELIVSVTDKGVGMNKETMDKLFRMDSICSKPSTNNETGTGLGLLLCKDFIEKHEGKIWAENNVPKGCIFHFSLPVQ